MLMIGLTGGIGSGKSIVTKIFQILSVPVYLADAEAKRLMVDDPELKEAIVRLLGSHAYKGNALNTTFIAGKIFTDPDLLSRLNELVHPVVYQDFNQWISKKSFAAYVIQESAILYESGFRKLFDYVIVVDALENIRIHRVMERDGMEEGEVRERMKNQMDSSKKKQLADYLITNNGDELIVPQVLQLHHKFITLDTQK